MMTHEAMKMKKVLLMLVLLLPAAALSAHPADSTTLGRAESHRAEWNALTRLAWENPAVKQWQHTQALSQVALSWRLRDEKQPLITQAGDRESELAFDAQTYMKHRTSTLWGRAFYHNGRQHGIRWNETSEPGVVYPYLLADSVVTAPMKVERYHFSGGYADRRGRWAWGADIGYTAGLYYRNVDPRPKNVTADLSLHAGVGLCVGKRYLAGAGVGFKKYKQTNNVAFYSEMGNEKIFHLTGLTNDYGRFAGTAYNTYYKGYRWNGTLSLLPTDRRGFGATVDLARFAFDNVLTTVNKLPMASVTDNSIGAEMTWHADDWGLRAALTAARRVGTENIFGDPAAAVYIQIGEIDMFHQNRFSTSLEGVWRHNSARAVMELHPAVVYNHLNTIYGDPRARLLLDDLTLALRARLALDVGQVRTSLLLGVQEVMNTGHELLLGDTKAELSGLERAVRSDYAFAAADRQLLTAAVDVHVPVGAFAVGGGVDWQYGFYAARNRTHNLLVRLTLFF